MNWSRRTNKNKRLKNNHSCFKTTMTGVSALIVTAFIALMIYWSVDSQCTAISREIGKGEKALAALDSEYGREMARWNEMQTPENLAEKIVRFGLRMQSPMADQVVHINADGRPAPGQIAVARARARSRNAGAVAGIPRVRKAATVRR